MSKKKSIVMNSWAMVLVSILIMAVLLIFINYIASSVFVRQDLTEDKVYTLSSGTKEILHNLSSPVTIRFYYSHNAENVPMPLKNYATRVEDLLEEYAALAGDSIRLEKLNPEPSTDAEDSATLDGVEGQQVSPGEKFYLGVSFSCIDQKSVLPFLSPGDENNLEYNISRALYRVANPKTSVIGVMSTLPVFGEQQNPMMMMQRQAQNTQPWVFITELKKDNEVREIPMTTEEIPEDVSTLIILHPKEITDATQYAIDQFLMRGGRLVAYVDPFCRLDRESANANPMMPAMPGQSSLPALFSAWGVDFDTEKVLVDGKFAYRSPAGPGQDAQVIPTVLAMNGGAVNKDDPVVNTLDRLFMADVGVLKAGNLMKGLERTVLLHSSTEAGEVERMVAMGADKKVLDDLVPTKEEMPLAIRLNGTFKSAFPDGRPGGAKDDNHLTESKTPTAVVIVADADMLYDDFWVRKMNMMGQQVAMIQSDNFYFLQNSIEQLEGDPSLISIRSRGVTNRPLEVLNDFERKAEEATADEIEKTRTELQDIATKINDLQRTKKDASQARIWTSEQLAEFDKAEQKKKELYKKVRELEKETRRQKDKLKNKITWINIGIVPFLLAHFGLILAVFRSRRRTYQRTQQEQES